MKLVISCDLKEFRTYYKTARGELGVREEEIIKQDSSHLILWRDDHRILGHAIWHESNTEEHKKGDPRDESDRKILKKLLGGKKEFIELHEIWLKEEHRGKGYGKKFFVFFEKFVAKKGYDSIIYYADDPSALAICRRLGYKEAYESTSGYSVFCKSVKK
ncbi:MAG: GNAT family N-acetyltransferase [Promethearchaeota archaeon]